MRLRDLPSVDELARGLDDPLAIDVARSLLDRAREQVRAGVDPGDLAGRLRDELTAARTPHLRRVLNATGVIAHTNLGRAPLAEGALERVREVARGYSNLEYDLKRSFKPRDESPSAAKTCAPLPRTREAATGATLRPGPP